MSKSTHLAPRLSLDQASRSSTTTNTSRARAVRSNAVSWAQDDEEKTLIPKSAGKKKTGLWKKVLKKISDLRSKEKKQGSNKVRKYTVL